MKTLKLTNRILKSLAITALMVLTVNVFADGDGKSSCSNAKNDSAGLKNAANAEMSVPAPLGMAWMVEEFEEELEVLDIEATYEMRPLWNVEAIELELEVKEYKPTEEVIPYWMIEEEEPELEVKDIVLN